LAGWPVPPGAFHHHAAAVDVDRILRWKSARLNEVLERERSAKTIASSLDAMVRISGDPTDEDFRVLEAYRDWLPELFIVSRVDLVPGEGELSVEAGHADGVRCPRTWRWVPRLVETEEWGPVSERCAEALRRSRQPA
jgi:hypothetical protein